VAAKRRGRGDARPPQAGEPEVLLDVECVAGRLYLVLANDGPATAFDVAVAFARPLVGVGGDVVISDLRIFQRLPLLRAGKEIRVFLDARGELARSRTGKRIEARVTYRDRTGQPLGETFKHDLRVWEDSGKVGGGADGGG